ncbi:MAG: CoA transferase [Pseudomonadota bacterium]|nr:CoA transferase [Pseudomonadota bacterium]
MNVGDYAQKLLAELRATPTRPLHAVDEHPALSWARSGLMTLTGNADGPPLLCPVPLGTAADGALAALAALAPAGVFDDLRGSALLTERAVLNAHQRRGNISPGGACRIFRTVDGAVALNLARDDDWALLPALFEVDTVTDEDALAALLAKSTMHDSVERGRLLGLPICPVVPPPSRPTPWLQTSFPLSPCGRGFLAQARTDSTSVRAKPRTGEGAAPVVVDLSSLWAGPLCSHLLQRCGANVIKVESETRPDGARRGSAAFYDLLNAGKRSVALDLTSSQRRAQLRALLLRADIVIEASRPRALRQMGIDADELLRERPGLTWISLTGYGRAQPQANWLAYGDDAGVAAGLSWLMQKVTGEAAFVGDAIADPITGIHAALAAWASWRAGGSRMIALALVDVLRHVIAYEAPVDADGWRVRHADWTRIATEAGIRSTAARAASGTAAALGADTAAVLSEFAIPC